MAKDKGPLEKVTKRQVNTYLRSLNEGVWYHYSAFGGSPGVADKLGLFRGQYVAIESKRPCRRTEKNGGLSPAQIIFKNDVLANGGHHITAYCGDDVKAYFETYLLGIDNKAGWDEWRAKYNSVGENT